MHVNESNIIKKKVGTRLESIEGSRDILVKVIIVNENSSELCQFEIERKRTRERERERKRAKKRQ